MQAGGLDWGEGYRPLGRQALAGIIEGRMAEAVDRWLDTLDGSALRDRRNGTYRRCLLSELGDIELNVPRTRHVCPTEVLKSYARRAPEIDRAILAGFVPGLSTRKVGEVLLALPGRPVSAATVSRVARTLDLAVAAFHRRPLKNACKALMPDGVDVGLDGLLVGLAPLRVMVSRREIASWRNGAYRREAGSRSGTEMDLELRNLKLVWGVRCAAPTARQRRIVAIGPEVLACSAQQTSPEQRRQRSQGMGR